MRNILLFLSLISSTSFCQFPNYMTLLRDFIKTFVARIELWSRLESKIKGRKVHMHGQIPALTMIALASPRIRLSNSFIEDLKKIFDLEPVLPVETIDWKKNRTGLST